MDRRGFLGMVPLIAVAPFAATVSFGDRKVAAERERKMFTAEEVKSLNAFQRAGVAHPYTCVCGRDANHLDGEGVLVATERGWICLYCD